jgi:hypothetical protein
MTVDMAGARITRSLEPFIHRTEIQRTEVIRMRRSVTFSLVVAVMADRAHWVKIVNEDLREHLLGNMPR